MRIHDFYLRTIDQFYRKTSKIKIVVEEKIYGIISVPEHDPIQETGSSPATPSSQRSHKTSKTDVGLVTKNFKTQLSVEVSDSGSTDTLIDGAVSSTRIVADGPSRGEGGESQVDRTCHKPGSTEYEE